MSTQQHGFLDGDMDTESEEMTTANHEAADAQVFLYRPIP